MKKLTAPEKLLKTICLRKIAEKKRATERAQLMSVGMGFFFFNPVNGELSVNWHMQDVCRHAVLTTYYNP